MRLILAALSFFTLSVFAAPVITLAPGSSAAIQPGTEKTVVVCAPAGPARCSCTKQTNGKFCARYYNFTDGDFYCAGPGTSSFFFESSADCELALPSIPVCY